MLINVRLWLKTIRLTWMFRFAHHPLCERFNDHVWQIGHIFICQGCTLVLLGVLAGTSFFLLSGASLKAFEWLIIGLICFIFPSTVELLNIKTRWVKRITRWVIGCGLGSFFWILITISDLLVLFTASIILIVGFYLFRKVRVLRSYHGDRCEGCPELARGGVCSGLQHEAEAMRKYSEYATELLEDKLRSKAFSIYQRTSPENFKDLPSNAIENE
ncbi:MAG: hypothetical protein ACFFD4_17640 [Candidatus Odinarchaeota archaeon]